MCYEICAEDAQTIDEINILEATKKAMRRCVKGLEEKGFKNAQGDKITNTPSSVATMMVSPSGFAINVGEHIRKEEE